MTKEAFDYHQIEAAVLETARGRWFLSEFARRNRHADTELLLVALGTLEGAIRERPAVEADRVRSNLVDMARAIAQTKAEIAPIKPDTEDHGRIGQATEELDAIVQSTESATSEILSSAEHIQELAWMLREQGAADSLCDVLDQRATDVYTACSFQDLTGQRIRKVINVMQYLEARINAMIAIWGLDDVDVSSLAQEERDRLLNGPALPGLGLEQADVDAMMAFSPELVVVADEPVTAVAPEVVHEVLQPQVTALMAQAQRSLDEALASVVEPVEAQDLMDFDEDILDDEAAHVALHAVEQAIFKKAIPTRVRIARMSFEERAALFA